MRTSVLGIHHVSAVAGDPQRNVDFYAGTLGLRLVKRTVNFDDPRSYHLYYGDGTGTPGTILTFFPWPGAPRGRAGAGQAAVTSLAVAPESIGWWIERFVRHGVEHETPTTRFGAPVLAFRDADGLMLELVGDPAAGTRPAWEGSDVPAEHAIHGMESVTLWVDRPEATVELLTDALGFRPAGEEGPVARFAARDGGPGTRVDVRTVGGFLRPLHGAGTVHHVAWRAADEAAERAIRQQVADAGMHPTPVIDRQYFRSVYFREPGRVLFELATDAPGFAVDEPVESLGEALKLPPRYEPDRAEIEAGLLPLHLPGVPARGAA